MCRMGRKICSNKNVDVKMVRSERTHTGDWGSGIREREPYWADILHIKGLELGQVRRRKREKE